MDGSESLGMRGDVYDIKLLEVGMGNSEHRCGIEVPEFNALGGQCPTR